MGLMPYPKSVEIYEGCLQISDGSLLIRECGSDRVRRLIQPLDFGEADLYCHINHRLGTRVPCMESDCSYTMVIDDQGITIRSPEEWGAITAVSTLTQLLLLYSDNLPYCTITDAPTYPWRGLMIDTARHFITLPTLKRTCEFMHYFKMNVLHLHLTDDQAFRFGTEQFEELVSDSYYTKSELAELIAFAADRAIRVVPEIDVPGHTSSWLLAHPEWGTQPADSSSTSLFGAHSECLDPSNPEVVKDITTIFEEVAETFPDDYIHTGGDEVDQTWWEESEKVQNWASKLGLKDTRAIQSHFTHSVCKSLRQQSKRPIVWDEALHEDLPEWVTVQAWRGSSPRDRAVDSGHATIVSSPYYLDLHYPARIHHSYWPDMSTKEWFAADDQVMSDPSLEHVQDGVRWHLNMGDSEWSNQGLKGEIVGGEACMWSELVTDELLHTRVWTRTPAIAERYWNGAERKDDVYNRLWTHLEHLPKIGFPRVVDYQSIHECVELMPLFEMLEPVKWYARLLSMDLVRARAKGLSEGSYTERPYNVHTPLNRVVDRLPPESLSTIRFIDAWKQEKDISAWLRGWKEQAQIFDECVSNFPNLEELRQASAALAELANVAEGVSPFEDRLLGPFGEYLLPVALAFREDT